MTECEFRFAALAEKHNAVIRKIREIPPWEWGGEFLELEPTNRGINRHKTAQSYNGQWGQVPMWSSAGQRGQSPCWQWGQQL